ncbi:MAG TPA: pitrilysin family protein, partial [Terriglobales bacterium]|nr:pitrilysin family protein [Terriglobales bacterium]
KVEDAYAAYIRERDKPVGRDEAKLKQLQADWQNAIKDAQQYVIPNQFGEIIERNGGEGMNAFTAEDQTAYFYSFPVNRLQLWAYLESQRYSHPVFREFYKERNVVIEERRMRTDSNPIGRLVEQFIETAFSAHPYHRPTIGYISDLNSFSATDAQHFFDTYYIPSNMVVAVVGDVDPAKTMDIIEKYFSGIPSRPKPDERTTTEPPQDSERRVVLYEQSQPIYLEGYHRPSYRDKDDAVYDALADLLSEGRTSRLYRTLVRDKKIASEAEGGTGFPGVKYPHIFYFFAAPMPGHTPEEVGDAIHAEIDKLKKEDISDDELKMVKTRAKANLIRSLDSNEGLAQNLAEYQTLYGDWRELFRSVDRIDAVSKADIRRVANEVFVPTNRTVAIIEHVPATSGGAQ